MAGAIAAGKRDMNRMENIHEWKNTITFFFFSLLYQCCVRVFVLLGPEGNTVILKPSELSRKTEKLLVDLIPKYLNKECYKVFIIERDVNS